MFQRNHELLQTEEKVLYKEQSLRNYSPPGVGAGRHGGGARHVKEYSGSVPSDINVRATYVILHFLIAT